MSIISIELYIYTWKANCHQSLDEKVKPNMANMEAFWTSVSGPMRPTAY